MTPYSHTHLLIGSNYHSANQPRLAFAKVAKQDVSRVFSLDSRSIQDCTKSLCDQVGPKAFALQGDGTPSLELETDTTTSLVSVSTAQPDCRAGAGSREFPAVGGNVFFRPVDGNLSYHTFLGDGFNSDFDCLGQVMTVVKSIVSNGRIDEVFLGSSTGEPKAMTLSKMTFQRLSTSLKIWDYGESGYHAHISDMCLACASAALCPFFSGEGGVVV